MYIADKSRTAEHPKKWGGGGGGLRLKNMRPDAEVKKWGGGLSIKN